MEQRGREKAAKRRVKFSTEKLTLGLLFRAGFHLDLLQTEARDQETLNFTTFGNIFSPLSDSYKIVTFLLAILC